MKCPKCQFEIPEGSRFCNECGSQLELTCPKCGKANPPGSRFCNGCAHDLKQRKEPLSVDYSNPQSYIPKFLANKILTTRSSIEGERKLVTVLFADVANFTAMSEKLDPEEVHQIMDGCFRNLMDEIHKYEGTINQFTGDGVMALFGAPVAHEDHAQRACYAALSIQSTLADYGEKLKKDRGIDFKMRIGLNSGPVVVGSIGDDLRMDYTAIGDTINLASRMETTAKPGTVLVSGFTHRLVRDYFKFESLGKIQVKGKEKPQDAYELLATSEVKTRIEAAAVAGLTKFVGRRREMEALQEALERTRTGSGQVVGIVGEAGVGKSRLILEMRRLFPKEEYGYLEGRCLHYGGSMAYLPLLDILRSYFGIKEGEQESLIKKKMEEKIFELDEKLKTVLPPFQELLSLKVEDEAYLKLEPKQKREKIFEAMRDLFIRESHFYKDAINILKQKPETEQNKKEHLEVILLMAVPMRLLGYPEDSLKFLEEGERLSKDFGDKKSLAAISNFIGLFYAITGDVSLERKYQEVSVEAENIQNIETAVSANYGHCFSYLMEGEFKKIVNIAPRIILLIERTNREYEFFGIPSNPYSSFHAWYGLSLGLLGEFMKGEQLCEKALSFAHKINHSYTIGTTENLFGALFATKGDGENVVKHLQSSIGQLEKSQGAIHLPHAWSLLGFGYCFLGELETALKFIEKGLKMQMDLGFPFPAIHFYLSFVHFDLGNLNEAKVDAEQALKLAQTSNQKYFEGMSQIRLGRALGKMERSQLHKAEECIVKGMTILDELKIKPNHAEGYFSLGELYADAGQKEKALENLKKAETMFKEMGMDYWLARTKKLLETVKT